MLTRFLEKRQIKAHCYWPQELGCSEEFGDLSLMLTSVRKLSPGHITLRTFRLTHMPSGDVRDIAHIHYTEWCVGKRRSTCSPPNPICAPRNAGVVAVERARVSV